MVPLLNECVEFVRYHSTPEAEDTEEWHEFKERMLAGRPETFDILQSVWERYQTHLNQQGRTSLLRQLEKPEPTPDPPPGASVSSASGASASTSLICSSTCSILVFHQAGLFNVAPATVPFTGCAGMGLPTKSL